MSQAEFGIRGAQPGDESLIYDSWLRSFASSRTGPWKSIGGERLLDTHRGLAKDLMARSRTRVMCDLSYPVLAVGWICCEGDVLHYVYTKKKFRRHGICSLLVDDAGELAYYSHPSVIAARWLGRRYNLRPSFGHLFYPPPKGSHATEGSRSRKDTEDSRSRKG